VPPEKFESDPGPGVSLAGVYDLMNDLARNVDRLKEDLFVLEFASGEKNLTPSEFLDQQSLHQRHKEEIEAEAAAAAELEAEVETDADAVVETEVETEAEEQGQGLGQVAEGTEHDGYVIDTDVGTVTDVVADAGAGTDVDVHTAKDSSDSDSDTAGVVVDVGEGTELDQMEEGDEERDEDGVEDGDGEAMEVDIKVEDGEEEEEDSGEKKGKEALTINIDHDPNPDPITPIRRRRGRGRHRSTPPKPTSTKKRRPRLKKKTPIYSGLMYHDLLEGAYRILYNYVLCGDCTPGTVSILNIPSSSTASTTNTTNTTSGDTHPTPDTHINTPTDTMDSAPVPVSIPVPAPAPASVPSVVPVVPVPVVIDPDMLLSSPYVDARHTFLEMCQYRHYQFDTLRHAKHSSLLLLYHLHHPFAQHLRPNCHNCHKIIRDVRWHCDDCSTHNTVCNDHTCVTNGGMDYDICNDCYNNHNQYYKHPHVLTPYRVTFI